MYFIFDRRVFCILSLIIVASELQCTVRLLNRCIQVGLPLFYHVIYLGPTCREMKSPLVDFIDSLLIHCFRDGL